MKNFPGCKELIMLYLSMWHDLSAEISTKLISEEFFVGFFHYWTNLVETKQKINSFSSYSVLNCGF